MASTVYEAGVAQLVPKFKTCCPICGQMSPVGFLGGNNIKRFYCCDCGVEFVTKNSVTCETFQISSHGTVEPVN